jgi:hypothetical protein
MLTGNEKAWAAFIIGTIVQSLAIVTSMLPVDVGTVKIYLLVITGIVGTIGQGLGVYQVSNSVKPTVSVDV